MGVKRPICIAEEPEKLKPIDSVTHLHNSDAASGPGATVELSFSRFAIRVFTNLPRNVLPDKDRQSGQAGPDRQTVLGR